MSVLNFIKDQLLSMHWLDSLIKSLLQAVGMDPSSHIFDMVNFFIYDTIKIILLLMILVFIISFIQSFFSPEKSKNTIMKFSGIGGNFVGAILGILTPFCSCSSIPIFIGFMSAGMPLGVTFSFLITSPMVDLAAVMLLMGEIGSAKIAILYAVFGVLIGVFGGMLIGRLKMEDQVKSLQQHAELWGNEDIGFGERIKNAFLRSVAILKQTWWAILIGVAVGGVIHGYIPTEWITSFTSKSKGFAPVISTLLGIPMYSSTFGTIPIAAQLYFKGMDIGTVLSFMMAVTALSVPSMIMISRVIKKKLLFTFIAIVAVGIILAGYVFNFLEPFLG